MTIDLTRLTIAGARDALARGELTAVELTDAALAAAERARPLNSLITETPELARKQAAASDARRAQGRAGKLDGIPLAVKDLYCTEGVLTTAGSHILDNFVPPYESTVTAQLFAEGAVMVGKANLDQFGMGGSNENSHFGPAVNPWRRRGDTTRLVPGGSSGGSAAAVAAGIALGSTATDTGGSIRQPAAFNGVTGLKPTYGRCSRWGIIAFASSLDQAGPIARDVRDCAIMLGAMAGHDPKDSTSVDRPVPDYEAGLEDGIKGLRIGVPREYRVDGMPAEIEKLWIVAPAEASSNLARYDGVRYGLRVPGNDLNELYENTRAEGFGAEVRRRILIGTYVLSAGYYDAYYLKAQKVRTLLLRDFEQAFGRVDAILAPTTPGAAYGIGEKSNDPVAMYLGDVFTVPLNLAGLPGMSLPAGLSAEGLPLGLQVIGRAFDEGTVLKVGRALEKAAAFTGRPDVWW